MTTMTLNFNSTFSSDALTIDELRANDNLRFCKISMVVKREGKKPLRYSVAHKDGN